MRAIGLALVLLLGGAVLAVAAPTTASNKALAESDAPKLLALVNLPAGSSSQSSEPPGDGGRLASAPSRPGTALLVDVHKFWRVPESFQSTVAFIKAHPPEGSTSGGSGSFTGPGVPQNEYLEYDFPDISGRVSPRLLLINVVRLSGGSAGVRADAQEVWMVARPAGERVPRAVRQIYIRSETWSQHPIVSLTVTDRAKVRRIVGWINSFEVRQPFVYHCRPQGPGDQPVVTFAFRDGDGIRLARATASGVSGPCNPIALVIRGRWQLPLLGGDFLERVQRLLHVSFEAPRTARVVGIVRVCGAIGGSGCWKARRGRAEVFDQYGGMVATHRLRHGRFSFRLAPGRYVLFVAAAGHHMQRSFHVRANKTKHLPVQIALK